MFHSTILRATQSKLALRTFPLFSRVPRESGCSFSFLQGVSLARPLPYNLLTDVSTAANCCKAPKRVLSGSEAPVFCACFRCGKSTFCWLLQQSYTTRGWSGMPTNSCFATHELLRSLLDLLVVYQNALLDYLLWSCTKGLQRRPPQKYSHTVSRWKRWVHQRWILNLFSESWATVGCSFLSVCSDPTTMCHIERSPYPSTIYTHRHWVHPEPR